MKTILLTLPFLCLSVAASLAAEAPVVLVTTKCHDLFVVDLGNKRYALLEWYGGYHPEKGDRLIGDFVHFGVQDMQLSPNGPRLRVWVDDYDLTQDAINDKLADKCD